MLHPPPRRRHGRLLPPPAPKRAPRPGTVPPPASARSAGRLGLRKPSWTGAPAGGTAVVETPPVAPAPKPAPAPLSSPAASPKPETTAVAELTGGEPPARRPSARPGWWLASVMLVLGSITVSEIQHGPALPPVVLPSPSASPAPSVAPEVQPGPVHEVTGFLSLIASPQDDGRPRVLTSLTQRVEGRLSCQGSVEYGDVTAGAPVTVFDSHGAAVASGVLGQGRAADETVSADDNIACLFPFTVSRVPADRGPYQIDIAQRGAVPVEGAAEGGVLRVFVSLGD